MQYASPAGFGPSDSGLYELGSQIQLPDLEHPLPGVQEIIERARKRLDEAGSFASSSGGWATRRR